MKGGESHNCIIVALDFDTPAKALALTADLDPHRCRLKVGKELFTRSGPALVERLVADGFDVFLDLKFHDIPHTVAKACQAAADLGVWMVNVHALGGRRMLVQAREALEAYRHKPLLIAVTVLTSLDEQDLHEIGCRGKLAENALRLAALAHGAGLDGVVCSPWECTAMRSEFGKHFHLVTPGIRPRGAQRQDQKRVMTPGEAIAAGSDYLVVGRAVTAADKPQSALEEIQAEIDTL